MASRNHLLSQHFLKNPRLALILIGHSNLKKRDTVIEIGAGSGVITSALAKRVTKVIAIEPDAETVVKLKKHLARQNCENVEIIEKDFMDYELPSENYKVFSNPPFHLSSAILHKETVCFKTFKQRSTLYLKVRVSHNARLHDENSFAAKTF